VSDEDIKLNPLAANFQERAINDVGPSSFNDLRNMLPPVIRYCKYTMASLL